MRKVQTNCPNCGAVMDSDKCQYCGTILYDFASLDADQPFFIKIKRRNRIYRFRVCLTEMLFKAISNNDVVYSDNNPFVVARSPSIDTLDLNFTILPYEAMDRAILGMTIDTDEIGPDVRPY